VTFTRNSRYLLLLLFASILSPIIPLLVGIRNRVNLLSIYLLTALGFDIAISLIKRVFHVNIGIATNLFILAEFVLLSLIIRKNAFRNNSVFIAIASLLALFFIAHTVWKSVFQVNITGASIFIFLYIIYGILGLYAILREQAVTFLERSGFFWFCIAVIIYASGAFLLFLFRDYIVAKDAQLFGRMWQTIFLCLNITKNLLLAPALKFYYSERGMGSH